MSAICTQEVRALQASGGMCGLWRILGDKGASCLRQALAALIALYHDPNLKHAGTIADAERRGSLSD